MPKGKKYSDATKRFDREHLHGPSEAVELVKSLANAKFDESIEDGRVDLTESIVITIDPKVLATLTTRSRSRSSTTIIGG